MKQERPALAPRVLRFTQGKNEPLAQNAAHSFASRHALVHFASGTVFTFIPKNACTSLRVSLAFANGAIASVDDWTWVHKNNTAFSADLRELARATATAVILRCPYRRLASTFLDKIVSRRNELWELYGKNGDGFDVDRLTFRSFVDHIGKPGIFSSDIHWRPQADFLVYQAYDRVFSMEDLPAFAAFFHDSTGQRFIDARPFSGHTTSAYTPGQGDNHADTPLSLLTYEKSQGLLPDAAQLYDAEILAKVSRLYACDLDLYHDLIGEKGLLFSERAQS